MSPRGFGVFILIIAAIFVFFMTIYVLESIKAAAPRLKCGPPAVLGPTEVVYCDDGHGWAIQNGHKIDIGPVGATPMHPGG